MTETNNQHVSSAEIIAFAEIQAVLAYLKECQWHIDNSPKDGGAIAKRSIELLPALLKQSQEASVGHKERLAYWVKRLGLDKKE
tara:strand:- start:120 stop:371 length:252 start_codon:yes stop_codon:yes gene_type:complete